MLTQLTDPSALPKDKIQKSNPPAATCEIQPAVGLRVGMTCPRCGQATIDYDGLLQLVCPHCGLKEAGACT